jgi:hypothetical protein
MSDSKVLVVVMCSHGTKGIGMIVISCVQWPLINILQVHWTIQQATKQYDMILMTWCYRVCLERYVLSLAEAESLKQLPLQYLTSLHSVLNLSRS